MANDTTFIDIKDLLYPVGSVYFTYSGGTNFSPAEIFGGQWDIFSGIEGTTSVTHVRNSPSSNYDEVTVYIRTE